MLGPMTKAQELLAAKARRVRLARQRVVAATLATFVLAWGVVAFDGSMGTTSVAATPTSTSTESTTTTDGGTTSYSDGAADMTTSQS